MQHDGSETILCPVDFSELSGYALRYAVEIAECRRAPVIALHTSSWEVPACFTTARIAELQKEFRGAQRAAARALREFIESTLGNAAEEIIRLAGENQDHTRQMPSETQPPSPSAT